LNVLSYMDPGSGSLLAQLAVAGVAGAAVAARMGWRRTAARLQGMWRTGEPEASDDPNADGPATEARPAR
jgi:hypothetical protein